MDNIFESEFVPNIQEASYHPKWVRANPGEAAKWAAFRDAVLAYKKGNSVAVPVLATKYGKALVAAGKEHMSVIDLGAVWDTPPPPPPPGDPLPPSWQAPLVITSGGVYDGFELGYGWESTSPTTPAVRIDTNQPVTIRGWLRNVSANGGSSTGSRCIYVTTSQAQVTVEFCWIYGGSTYQTSGRWFEAVNFRTVLIQNCTIQFTRGIQLEGGIAGSTVTIRRNRHTNVQGNGTSPVGNFVQFRDCLNPDIEVAWNEVTNYYNQSNPEDIINIYHSSNCHIHDNMLRYQTAPGNPSNSTQGGITVDMISAGSGGDNHVIENNQMIATEPILIWATNGANNNMVLNNRIVDSGKIDGGSTNCNTRGLGIHVLSGGQFNHAHGNQVGVVKGGSRTVDWKLEGCEGGDAGEGPNNTHMPDPINVATETAEWNIWLAKLASNNVEVGA